MLQKKEDSKVLNQASRDYTFHIPFPFLKQLDFFLQKY
jgi:hypothetical protein